MSNSDTDNYHLTYLNNMSPSPSLNSMLTSPPPNATCSTSTTPTSSTPRRIVKAKRSLVWRYFSSSNEDELNAECLLCSSTILRKTSSTANLLHHIQAQHNSEYETLNKAMKLKHRSSDLSSRLPLTSDRSIHLTKLIADLIIYNFLPLSIAESPHLQAIVEEAEPSYIIPKRKYFMNNVLKGMYNEVRERVYQELQLAPGICLTTDIWTSQANQAYITVTAHFVDVKNNQIKMFVLETKEFTGNHTAERIVERLVDLCNEWSIIDKIICLVSDTCSTMRKVGIDFGKGWIGCSDHLINLCVNDVIRKLDEVKNALVLVRHIVSYVRDCHLANEMLNKYQKSFGFAERQLIFDVKTRWNSSYYMLQRFILEKLCITACLNENLFIKNLNNNKLSRIIEWEMLEQLMIVLEPFEAATRKLAMDSSPTLSILLPVLTSLITSLECQSNDFSLVKKIKDTLRASIEDRFKDVYQDKLILLCTVLDPRWKEFSFLQRFSYQNHSATSLVLNKLQAFEAKQTAYEYINETFSHLLGNNVATLTSNVQLEREKEKEFDIFDILVTNQNVALTTGRDSELLLYESEREISRNQNPLEWWNANKTKYPTLSKLAYTYLCITGTSVPSERMFSTAGLLTSDRRSRLTPENADILIFLNKNR